jgi:hypothetical protein
MTPLLALIVFAGIVITYLGVLTFVTISAMSDDRRTFTDDDIDALTDAVVEAARRDAAG